AHGVRGKIIFNGKEIQSMSGNKISSLGLIQVLEGRHVFSKLTVEENLMTGAYMRKDTKGIKDDIDDVYRRFPRLLERRTQAGGTLSGGEQQMLAMGRALMARPKLLMLDEPSMGLAPLIVKEIFVAINDINKSGTTVLFVEQNSKIALSTADRGYVMQTGEMVMHDTCANLMTNEDIKKAYLGG
ncbi:MAG: ABC transporter ATP-binding protein, partial [Oscillospiraceae bacterium]